MIMIGPQGGVGLESKGEQGSHFFQTNEIELGYFNFIDLTAPMSTLIEQVCMNE